VLTLIKRREIFPATFGERVTMYKFEGPLRSQGGLPVFQVARGQVMFVMVSAVNNDCRFLNRVNLIVKIPLPGFAFLFNEVAVVFQFKPFIYPGNQAGDVWIYSGSQAVSPLSVASATSAL
jgi:hypothetical protein